jgi:uncharacterized protein YjgD (DUF1641 family)
MESQEELNEIIHKLPDSLKQEINQELANKASNSFTFIKGLFGEKVFEGIRPFIKEEQLIPNQIIF